MCIVANVHQEYTFVDEYHQFLGHDPEGIQHREVAEANKEMLVGRLKHPMLSSSIELPNHRIPFGIRLEGVSALSRTITGQQRWDDPAVIIERNIVLFGPADERSRFLIDWRKKAIVAVYEAFKTKMKVERALFGGHSVTAKGSSNNTGEDVEMGGLKGHGWRLQDGAKVSGVAQYCGNRRGSKWWYQKFDPSQRNKDTPNLCNFCKEAVTYASCQVMKHRLQFSKTQLKRARYEDACCKQCMSWKEWVDRNSTKLPTTAWRSDLSTHAGRLPSGKRGSEANTNPSRTRFVIEGEADNQVQFLDQLDPAIPRIQRQANSHPLPPSRDWGIPDMESSIMTTMRSRTEDIAE
ncbi:hypothetical protein F5884DRAFT_860333 [Xylogone sp. PMI_703]|nr:hypothetical protein F5884DRAFT_860333 [Xylogone sp. PMI_703]